MVTFTLLSVLRARADPDSQLLAAQYADPDFRASLDQALSQGVRRISRLSSQMRFLARDAIADREALPLGATAERPMLLPGDLLAFKANFAATSLRPGVISVLALDGGYGGMVLAGNGIATVACCTQRSRLEALRSERARGLLAAWDDWLDSAPRAEDSSADRRRTESGPKASARRCSRSARFAPVGSCGAITSRSG